MRRALAAVLAAVSLTGCSSEGTAGGGQVVGETLTVYSLLPDTPVARDIVDGEKLALAEAGGRAGQFKVNFALDHLSQDDPEAVADTVRETIHDLQVIAVISDLGSETARTTIPLLNAGGILQISPGATYPGFIARYPGGPADEPGRWQPAPRRTFAPLTPTDSVQAVAIAAAARPPVLIEAEPDAVLADELRRRLGEALTTDPARARTIVYAGEDVENARGVISALRREHPRARILVGEALLRAGLKLPRGARFVVASPLPGAQLADRFRARFGRCASRYARLGYDAMKSVLAAIAQAGPGARNRTTVAQTWLRQNPDERLAQAPFELAAGDGC